VAKASSALRAGIFEIEQQNDTLIIVPAVDMGEWDYQRIEAAGREILELLNGSAIKNLVLDFSKTASYGSTALAVFLKLWKGVRMRNGRMAFCNVSDHEKEVLQITKLDKMWPICSSRSEALEAVKD
jgi:anti-anti-sigma factor